MCLNIIILLLKNIGKIEQELILDSGIFLINLKDVVYSLRTPTIIGRLGLYEKMFDIFGRTKIRQIIHRNSRNSMIFVLT